MAQNLYRSSGGSSNNDRFEQIGQSWVKHTYGAKQANGCNFGCLPGGNFTHLGVGCSDTYFSSQCAEQGDLGSRAWINPFTGVFSTNARNHTGHNHSAVSHMMVVESNDLNQTINPGATYYAELVYVTPDEYTWCQAHPGECNMYNNASYLRYSVTGTTNFSFSQVGSPVRMTPAISAWLGATTNPIEPDPGNDGRAFIAFKVTGPVAGIWHYEYALYNQNLERAVQSFSVPLGCGITVSNLGFHAPLNHPGFPNDGTQGDAGFSNAAWTSNQTASEVSWSTESFAQNQNANAIRWGTLYNFRFDSNKPPLATNATIGFFKTGTPVTVAILGPNACDVTPTPSPTATATATATATGTSTPTPSCAPLVESFEDITTLPGAGWVQINHSAVVGTTSWFQGNSAVFPAHSGAATSYIGANFNNTTATNTISNWLLTPTRVLHNGELIAFWTRTVDVPSFPDRLQVRMSINGASANVGTTATDVGDFTTLLLDINPTYTTSGYYPNVWTQFEVTVIGLAAPTTGRLAFRYFVENAGPTGGNSDYIGIDTFAFIDGNCEPSPSPTPTATATVPTSTPTPTPFFVRVFWEGFDAVTAPALPPGWLASFTPGPANCTPTGTCALGTNWATNTATSQTAPNAAFHDAPSCVTDANLDTPSIFIPTSFYPSVVNFWQNYDLEAGHDGGVLEISIDGGAFTDIVAAGGSFSGGHYNGTISTAFLSPIAGRPAWTGSSGGYVNTSAALPSTTMGHNVVLRFRLATDCSVAGTGWYVDSISIAYFNDVHFSPTPTATATATATSSPTPTATATATATPTATGTVTPAPSPTAAPAAQPLNLSTRMRVQTGANVGIGGFIITGSAPKSVLVRAIGPSLAGAGVPDPLADPVLELHGPPGFVTIVNDNWRDGDSCIGLFPPPNNDLESAICATLNPDAYTAIVRGKDNTSGTALVEVYDFNQAVPAKLANISTRAFVSTGADVVIAGFILGGNAGEDNLVLRGIGPSLTQVGVSNALANPALELRDGNGALLLANDDWQDDPAQAALISAAGLAPTNDLESAIAAILPPGPYTVLLAGLNNGTGVGLVEVYDRGTP